jgi:hypothetical protein
MGRSMEQRGTVLARIALALFVIGAAGCAREAVPATMAPASSYPSANQAYAWPPATLGSAPLQASRPLVAGLGLSAGEPTPAPSPPPAASRPPAPTPTLQSKTAPPSKPAELPAVDPIIPSADACLAALDASGTRYQRLESKKGIETPVVVSGPIGGLHYDGGSGGGVVADCRLVLALYRVAPILKQLGVTRLRYSGAYSYRMSKVGRLSYHAYGLAIDVHEFVINGKRLAVESDFARGLADGCAESSPELNQVACRLKATGMFKELLTPDYNADHHNHMHFGLAPTKPVEPPKSPATPPLGQAPPESPHHAASKPEGPAAPRKAPKPSRHAKKRPAATRPPGKAAAKPGDEKASRKAPPKKASRPPAREAKRKSPARS